jgi:hypothetical protein
MDVEFIPEEPVDFKRMVSVPGVDGAEDIERYVMFLQQPGLLPRHNDAHLASLSAITSPLTSNVTLWIVPVNSKGVS